MLHKQCDRYIHYSGRISWLKYALKLSTNFPLFHKDTEDLCQTQREGNSSALSREVEVGITDNLHPCQFILFKYSSRKLLVKITTMMAFPFLYILHRKFPQDVQWAVKQHRKRPPSIMGIMKWWVYDS